MLYPSKVNLLVSEAKYKGRIHRSYDESDSSKSHKVHKVFYLGDGPREYESDPSFMGYTPQSHELAV